MLDAAADAEQQAPAKRARRRAGSGLNAMVLPELQKIASGLGIKGVAKMRKGALIEAIQAAQASSGPSAADASTESAPTTRTVETPGDPAPRSRPEASSANEPRAAEASTGSGEKGADRRGAQASTDDPQPGGGTATDQKRRKGDPRGKDDQRKDDQRKDDQRKDDQRKDDQRKDDQRKDDQRGKNDQRKSDARGKDDQRSKNDGDDAGRNDEQARGDKASDKRNRNEPQAAKSDQRGNDQRGNDQRGNDDGEGGGRRRNRNRNRNRNRTREAEPQVTEDDVLIPAAGILDVLDNYAFVRTSGYLPGENDVYVSLAMVRKWGLRKGDAVVGQVRQPREGERKEKFNPLVKIESVNGMSVEEARDRVEFSKLTPLYASERLRLETDSQQMTGRIIDIVAPIGKGQRGLIVSPPKAGKTMVMQQIANAITTNNPECHLMVVLVDERPEEVTDFQRTVKGEVIASTFDRPATDHTSVAELAIERAKRLVELGHDVVVLLDGITRLGRAYNLAAPASGRILSGGVDSSALYPPKRFFGAARNIEDGGSLTILATALVETGSRMDEVIFEEFKGTGNMELRLRREFADRRIFPAIDAEASGTRREELLMSHEELAIVWKLRRVLSGLDGQQALELLLEKLRSTRTNVEFLMQVNKTTPVSGSRRGSDEE
ncbi:UNVERIFIED_CONTAM: transcription termination factor Rho [Mumia flava]